MLSEVTLPAGKAQAVAYPIHKSTNTPVAGFNITIVFDQIMTHTNEGNLGWGMFLVECVI